MNNIGQLIEQTAVQLAEVIRGGPGSGHHGHKGRPGKVGGSLPSGEAEEPWLPVGMETMEDYTGGGEHGWSEDRQTYTIYHGASRPKAIGDIREQGLKTPKGVGVRWYMLTTDIDEARVFAGERFAEGVEKGVVLEYRIPRNEVSKFLWPGQLTTGHYMSRDQVYHSLRETLPGKFIVAEHSLVERGGEGSGHHGHEGRPGEVGGSLPGDGWLAEARAYADRLRNPAKKKYAQEFITVLYFNEQGFYPAHPTPDQVFRKGRYRPPDHEFVKIFRELSDMAPPPKDEPDFDALYPVAGDEVGGREIRLPVPNTNSISASFTDYEILDGIREVKMADIFSEGEMPFYYSVGKKESTLALAEELKTSDWIEPLIVGVEAIGPHVIEGSHRIDALRELGEETFPAMIVIDRESLVERGGEGSGHFEHEGRPGEVGGSQPGDGIPRGRIGLTFETWQKQPFDEALAASYADAIEEKYGLTPVDKITGATWIAPDGRALSEGSNHEETSEHALAVVDGIDADDFTISETQIIQAGLIRHTFWAYGQETFVISGADTLTIDQKRVVRSIMDTRVNQRASVKIPSGRDTELVGLRIFIVEDVPPSIDPISRALEHVDSNQTIRLLGLSRNEWRSSPLGQGLVVSTAPRTTQMGELITETRPAITVKGILRRIFYSRHASPKHPGTGTEQQVHAGDGAGVDTAEAPSIPSGVGEPIYHQTQIERHMGPDFAGDEEGAHEWGQANFPESYPTEQYHALYNYKNNTFEGVNQYLRGTWAENIGGSYQRAAIFLDDQIEHIDSVMAENTVPEDIITYRGMNVSRILEEGENIVGKTFKDGAYVSTTLSLNDANKFATDKSYGALARILVPAGTHATYMDFHQIRQEMDEDMEVAVEEELLLDRGMTFRVVGFNPSPSGGGVPELDLEIVP